MSECDCRIVLFYSFLFSLFIFLLFFCYFSRSEVQVDVEKAKTKTGNDKSTLTHTRTHTCTHETHGQKALNQSMQRHSSYKKLTVFTFDFTFFSFFLRFIWFFCVIFSLLFLGVHKNVNFVVFFIPVLLGFLYFYLQNSREFLLCSSLLFHLLDAKFTHEFLFVLKTF